MVEAVEMHLVDVAPPLEADHHLAARQPRGELVGPVGGDQGQVGKRHCGELFEHPDTVGVGPVQVLEDHQRPAVTDTRGHGVDSHGAGVDEIGRGVVEHRADEVERAAERARLRLSDQHRRSRRERADELLEQAGLADAGLPGNEGDGGEVVAAFANRSGHQPIEPGERRRASDHHRTDAATTHQHVVESTDQRGVCLAYAGGGRLGKFDDGHVRSRRHHATPRLRGRGGRVLRISRRR